MAGPRRAHRRYFDGVNSEDWDDFRGIWHDDAVIEVVGGIRVQGWDEILPYYAGALTDFPVHYDDPYTRSRRRRHDHGRDRVHRRDASTASRSTFEAVDVFTLEDGLDPQADDLVRPRRGPRASCGRPARRSGGSGRSCGTRRRRALLPPPLESSRLEPTRSRPTSTLLPVTRLDGSRQRSSSRFAEERSRTSSSAATAPGR